MISVGCYIPCRNDAENLAKCLSALMNQALKPKRVVIVNDGSDEQVNDLAKSFGCESVNLPPHPESYVGSPLMASIHNVGLLFLSKLGSYDYVLVLGADHILPRNYLVDLVTRMRHGGCVIGSGIIEGERSREPRGSGRLINYSFFKEIGLAYPVNYGWEAWVLFKALSLGYRYHVYPDIFSRILRPTGLRDRGKDMYALGYNWKYALGRCVLLFFKSPMLGIMTFLSWFFCEDVERHDVHEFVNEYQSKYFWERIVKLDF